MSVFCVPPSSFLISCSELENHHFCIIMVIYSMANCKKNRGSPMISLWCPHYCPSISIYCFTMYLLPYFPIHYFHLFLMYLLSFLFLIAYYYCLSISISYETHGIVQSQPLDHRPRPPPLRCPRSRLASKTWPSPPPAVKGAANKGDNWRSKRVDSTGFI